MCQKSLSADERRKAARRVSCVGKGQVASVACTPGRGCGPGISWGGVLRAEGRRGKVS